jgi:hypothetical protein
MSFLIAHNSAVNKLPREIYEIFFQIDILIDFEWGKK